MNELSRVGIKFNESNELSVCLSLYNKTCLARSTALKTYTNEVISAYDSEVDMPDDIQKRMKNAVICINLLAANIKDESSPNCHY